MKTLIVSFGIYTLLAAVIFVEETQAAEVTKVCQQENGRFTYDHSTIGKMTNLTQLGLDTLRAEVGEPATSATQFAKCTNEKVSTVNAMKKWFKQFTGQAADKEQATDKEKATGLSREDTKVTHTANNGDFEAVLFMTQDAESILNKAGHTFHDESVSISIGETIEALLVFRGCKVNPNGNCLVTADYVIEAPDGSVYQQALNTDVWKETASPLKTYNLTNTRIGFVLQTDAEAGLYKVRVTLSDQISNIELSLIGRVLAKPRTKQETEKVKLGILDGQTNPWHEAPLKDIRVYTE